MQGESSIKVSVKVLEDRGDLGKDLLKRFRLKI